MRLTEYEQKKIKEAFLKSFGNGKIYLFGSRVDDSKKGGDIDLFIIPEKNEDLRKRKVDFLTRLYDSIGEQKIDIVISKDKNRLIEKEALRKGIKL